MQINENNYVDKAEETITRLSKKVDRRGNPIAMVTTSKIRNLLSMAADIYNQVLDCKDNELPTELVSRIDYLRVRFIYECGRDERTNDLIDEAGLIDILKQINGDKNNYILFYHYMEALVAFKKYLNKNVE